MNLSRLYSNKPLLFEPLNFQAGLNVVVAEIRLPENQEKDTHNLGKTTLCHLLDFTFLDDRDPDFFLFKHSKVFSQFIFFLEIHLDDKSFLTIRRGVEEATKISFKRHSIGNQDLTKITEKDWDHFDIPFDKAKKLLDGRLDWKILKPWHYRKMMGYLLRTQEDYLKVFQLRKFTSKHIDWKPFLAHILGFDGPLLKQHYDKEERLVEKTAEVQIIKNELGTAIEDISRLEGILLLKRNEFEKKQNQLDAFDFRSQDKEQTKHLVDQLDVLIAELNSERYFLTQNRRKITASLEEDQILFDPKEAQRLFQEAGVFFTGQIKKDFDQLIAFNRAITEERSGYLKDELQEIDVRISEINTKLNSSGKKRSEALSYLSTTDVFEKYKQVSDSLVILKADITVLERQRDSVKRLQSLNKEIQGLQEEKTKLQVQVEADIRKQDSLETSLFSSIRIFFSEIVEEVIGQKALLSVSCNKNGNPEFVAEILDESGNSTSADAGHTYRKLLCIAFDLAILRAHLTDNFPRFVFHDGVFESLDLRKKTKLLGVLRHYTELGLQPVITLIDSDLPPGEGVFSDSEVILKLHDEGNDGLLFKMNSW
ncbi:MAG: DUF2326 domain-containing protein [Verrucomicrobiota bacterium]